MTLQAEKDRLRRSLRTARRQMPASLRTAYDAKIAERVLRTLAWQQAETVFCYVSTGWEIDTARLRAAAYAAGKRLAVPLCREFGVMEAREIREDTRLIRSAYGILAPEESALRILPEEIDLILVPGVAFDRQGYRLGQGGGYYDRFLMKSCAVRLGLCYELFLLDAVPREVHDIRMNLMITEEETCTWV